MEIIELIFRYEYMQNAYIIGVILGVLAPLVGVFVVLRRMSLIVDGISHISLAGISFSLMLSKLYGITIAPIYSALIFATAGSLTIDYISASFKKYREVVIPIIVTVSLSLTVIFASLANGFNSDLLSYLFGNILTTTRTDIVYVLIALVVVIVLFKLFYYDILAFSLDEDYAKYSGKNVMLFRVIFSFIIAIVISISMKVVGMMLIGSMIIVPVSSAMRLSKSFKSTILISILLSELSVLSGLVLSYYLDIPSGATIVMISVIIFVSIVTTQKLSNKGA
jgi:zinc transport system permease protein